MTYEANNSSVLANRRECLVIYIVTGFMRSGTSMMMQALEAGGMPVVKSEQRDEFNSVYSDERYRPNPQGLYEPSTKEMRTPGFPRQHEGKAVKAVLPMLRNLAVHSYRVLFMDRDSEENRQSFEAAFGGKTTVKEIDRLKQEAWRTLENRRDVVSLTRLFYRDVLSEPVKALEQLDWPIDVSAAASVINPDLCRFRRESLAVGV